MEILETILSFSLVMVVMTTIATLGTEFVLRLMKQRRKGLEQMLGAMFDEALWPRFQHSAQKFAAAAGVSIHKADMREAFIAKLMGTKVKRTVINKLTNGDPSKTEMSPIEFLEELADTPFGQAINADLNALDGSLAQAIQNLLLKYDQAADEASRSFRTNSRSWTFLFGFITALLFAFNPVHVFDQIATEKTIREKLIAQKDTILVQSSEAQKRYTEALDNKDEEIQADLKAEADKLSGETKRTLNNLQNLGLPIGWKFSPFLLGKTCTNEADLTALPGRKTPFMPVQMPICTKLVYPRVYPSLKHKKNTLYHAIILAEGTSYPLKKQEVAFILTGNVKLIVPAENGTATDQSMVFVAGQSVSTDLDGNLELRAEEDTILALEGAATGNYTPAEIPKFKYAGTKWDVFIWFMQIAVGGLLIGLGGPFWFDTVRKLSMVTNVAKTVRQSLLQSAPNQAGSTAPKADTASAPATLAEQAVQRFKDVSNGIMPPPDIQEHMEYAKTIIADILRHDPEMRDQTEAAEEDLQSAAHALDEETMENIIKHLKRRSGELKSIAR